MSTTCIMVKVTLLVIVDDGCTCGGDGNAGIDTIIK